jgi:hypothetical protein
VQIVHGSRRGARDIEHLGSAHDEQAVEALKAVARQRMAGGQGQLGLGLDDEVVSAIGPGPLQIMSSRMAPLWEVLWAAYDQLGFAQVVEGAATLWLLAIRAPRRSPRTPCGSMKYGPSATSTMSEVTARLRPRPTAAPFTAATTGSVTLPQRSKRGAASRSTPPWQAGHDDNRAPGQPPLNVSTLAAIREARGRFGRKR